MEGDFEGRWGEVVGWRVVGFENPEGFAGFGDGGVVPGYEEVAGGAFAEGWAGEGAGV